jgi:hypothetical protein
MRLPDPVFNWFFILIEHAARYGYRKGRLAAKNSPAPEFTLSANDRLMIRTEYNKEFNSGPKNRR